MKRTLRWIPTGLLAAAALLTALLPASSAQQTSAAAEEKLSITAGVTVISAPIIDFDNDNRRHVFREGVDLVNPDTHMTATTMTVQLTPKKELEWAQCVGDVHIVRRGEGGSQVEAWTSELRHNEVEKKSDLKGKVRVLQASPRLAKPAEVLGERAELNSATQINVVFGSPQKQASVEVQPKGAPGVAGAAPVDGEPAKLIGDRIEMNQATQEYHATGNPILVRPSGTLKADDIRFQVDEKTSEIQNAVATGHVDYNGKSPKGSVIHAKGDKGTFDKSKSLLVLEGNVYATTLEPGDEQPSIWKGDRFEYNTTTSAGRLSRKTGRATIEIPQSTLDREKPKPGTPKPDAKPDAKPEEKKPAGAGKAP